MATLIPAIGACVSRMTSGERRLAERLEQKLDGDYLLWYDVPIGPKQTHPEFDLHSITSLGACSPSMRLSYAIGLVFQ